MRKLRAVLVAIVAAALSCAPIEASELHDVSIVTTTADVTLTTTSETVIVSSDLVRPSFSTSRIVVIAWGQLTLGTNTTGVTPRIRRGTTTSGTLIGEANNEPIKTAAGSTEPFFIVTGESVGNVDGVQYSLTLQQAGASANGSALQGTVLVMLF
jgi:hypothetical protein